MKIGNVDINIDKRLEQKYRNNPKSLDSSEKATLKSAISAALSELDRMRGAVMAEHPFWYYTPISGDISAGARQFLEKWIRADDIPPKLDGSVKFHSSERRIRLASGGNQSSKTYSSAIEGLIRATGKVPYFFDESVPKFYGGYKIPGKRWDLPRPQHVRVVGFDWENDVVKNLLPMYRKLAPKEYLVNGEWDKSWVASESTVYFREGQKLLGTIEFMSNKQDLASFGGPGRSLVIFDEEPFHEVYKENLLRMVTSPNFDVILSMTPINGITWVYDEIYLKYLAGDPDIDYFQFTSIANPHASLESLNEIMKGLSSYDERKLRLLGEFVSLSGLIYGGLFKKDVHVIPPFETGCTCGQQTHQSICPYESYLGFLGVDPHMVKPSCSALCFLDREDNFYVDTCYKKDADIQEFRRDHFELMKGKRMSRCVFDPSSDSSITAFSGLNIFKLCTQSPSPFIRAIKGEKYHGSIAAGVQTIKDRLKIVDRTKRPRFFIFDRPENQELIKSMRMLQRDTYSNEDERGKKDKIQEGLHDHHACVRYILQNKLRWYPNIVNLPQPIMTDEEAIFA